MSAYKDLVHSLDQLVTVYRHLLDVVRKENQVLKDADMKEVPELNLSKEKLVFKVKQLDDKWQSSAKVLARQLKLDNMQPKLQDLAKNLSGEQAEKLEKIHSVLNILVERIAEINKKNAVLVKSVLSHITGAMDSITSTLNENPTYGNRGSMDDINKDAQGRLVHREA